MRLETPNGCTENGPAVVCRSRESLERKGIRQGEKALPGGAYTFFRMLTDHWYQTPAIHCRENLTMGIKTEDFVPGFPPKEMTEGVDWLGILDVFDPSALDEKYLNECARRNPYETCYKSEPPFRSVGERLRLAKFCVGSYRRWRMNCWRSW